MKNNPSPTLILFCGLPGSGKTTLAKQLEKQNRGLRICTDDWQEDLKVEHADDNFHGRLQRRLYKLALEVLERGQNVVLEDGLWTKPEREEKLADAKSRGANTELHFFDLSLDEIQSRLNVRNEHLPHGAVFVTEQALEKSWNKFQRPGLDELNTFDKVFIYKDESKLDMISPQNMVFDSFDTQQ